jgi:hypothetical protein
VRSFRVLIIQDSRTLRRPAHRKAQLTVWDVLQLALFEGHTAGKFEMGQRFLVRFLTPSNFHRRVVADIEYTGDKSNTHTTKRLDEL